MWYRSVKIASQYEAKIVYNDAERIVRRKLFYSGKANASIEEVARITKRVMDRLKKEYGNLNSIRRQIGGDTLSPAVEKAVESVMH